MEGMVKAIKTIILLRINLTKGKQAGKKNTAVGKEKDAWNFTANMLHGNGKKEKEWHIYVHVAHTHANTSLLV